MLYRPASSRKSSLVVSAATAAALFAGTSMLVTYPAIAGEPVNKFAAECASKKNAADHAGCMVDAMNKETARLKREGRTFDVKIRSEDTLNGCLVSLADFKKNSPAEFSKLGAVTRDNACMLAGKLPKPTASAARKPSAG